MTYPETVGLSWVSSSAVLAVIIVLCVVWFAPRVARRTNAPVRAQMEAPDLQTEAVIHKRERVGAESTTVHTVASSHVHERETKAMETTAPAPGATTVQRGSLAGLRIKWDRTLIFLAGVLLLLAAVVSALAAPLTAVSWAVPVVLFLLGAGCVAGLRYLAVTDREQRAAARPVTADVAPVQYAIFDNEDEDRQEAAQHDRELHASLDLPVDGEQPATGTAERPAEPVYTVAELRAEALKVARSAAPAASSATTWQPVPVPKPLYTQAPVVERSEPEPLRVPERPAARSTSLKEAVRAGEKEPAALNLDDVLKRRRA